MKIFIKNIFIVVFLLLSVFFSGLTYADVIVTPCDYLEFDNFEMSENGNIIVIPGDKKISPECQFYRDCQNKGGVYDGEQNCITKSEYQKITITNETNLMKERINCKMFGGERIERGKSSYCSGLGERTFIFIMRNFIVVVLVLFIGITCYILRKKCLDKIYKAFLKGYTFFKKH